MRRVLTPLFVTALALRAAPLVAVQATDLPTAIRQVEEGDLEIAVVTLNTVIQRLSGVRGREKDLATAHLYLAMAHLGLSQLERAKASVREAWKINKDLALDPKKFPPALLQYFEEAGTEALAGSSRRSDSAPSDTAATRGGTVTGKVTILDKGRRPATDLADVVVFVDGVKARPRPATVSMAMKGKAFAPHVVVVLKGGTVEFPNEDPIFHNVFSVSGENRFDLDFYKRPTVGRQTFEHAGVVRVYCNIHPQMAAVVLVRDNPYFAKVSEDGSFRIEGVPAGKHTVKAWHERAGEAVAEVTVTAQSDVKTDFSLDASKFKVLPHRNKYGKDYSIDER